MASNELEPILAVEKELDKVIAKFTEIRENATAELNDVATLLDELMQVLGKAEQEMSGTINTGTQVDTDDPMNDEAEMQVEMERTYIVVLRMKMQILIRILFLQLLRLA